MPLTLNTSAVIRSFADNPGSYPDIQSDLAEVARKLLIKQVKAKSTDAALLKKLCKLTGAENLAIAFDCMTDKELMGLLKRIDPHSPLGKGDEDTRAIRAHVNDLATGHASLSAQPVKATAQPRKPKTTRKEPGSKIGEVLNSKVHSGEPRKRRKKT